MKKLRIVLVASILLTFAGMNALGQERELSEAEIIKKVRAAETGLRGLSYRASSTVAWVGEADPGRITTLTVEFISPDRRRLLQENGVPEPFKTREIINFDGRNYVRYDYQAWKVFSDPLPSEAVRPATAIPPVSDRKTTETAKLIERTVINGRNVNVYEIRTEVVNAKNGAPIISSTRQAWLREDGRLVKAINDIKPAAQIQAQRTTVHYEYDTNIVIDEPVVTTGN